MDTRKTIIITREDLKNKLIDWSKGKINEKQIMEWAEEQLISEHEFDDSESENEDSVAREVTVAISNLNMNLIIKDDIPIYLKFLETTLGQFEIGYEAFNKEIDLINYDERKNILRNSHIYSKYC